jgi:hypothetical protein
MLHTTIGRVPNRPLEGDPEVVPRILICMISTHPFSLYRDRQLANQAMPA